jgi:hypothetical protein
MSTSDSGLRDGVDAELNPADGGPDYGPQADSIPDRPADAASTEKWVDYVVTLGASRPMVTGETEHFDGSEYVTEPSLSRAQLIELADRLGG